MSERTAVSPPDSSNSTSPPGHSRSTNRPGITLAILLSWALIYILDASIVTIALPHIQTSLGFSTASLSWVLNAYTLAFGGLLLLGGRAGDILGRRRVFVAGVILFTVASFLAGLANSAELLLAARALQGVGAAIAGPSTLALIVTNFPEGPQRSRALSAFAAVASSGLAIGMIAGGLLTGLSSWRWVFFVTVPIGIAVAILAPRFLTESPRNPGRFDLAGAVTGTLGMTALVYGFIRTADGGWTDGIALGSLALAVVLLVTFVVLEARARQPLMPLGLFASRSRTSALLIMLFVPATMFGMFYFLTQFLQSFLGLSPLLAGLAFMPFAVTMFVMSRVTSRIMEQLGPRRMLLAGLVLLVAGILWLTQISASTRYDVNLVGPMVLLSLGASLAFLPANVSVLTGLRPDETGAASGLLQTMQQVGAAVGLSVLVTVYGSATSHAVVVSHAAQASGMATGFTVSVVFAVAALVIGYFGLRERSPHTVLR
jgi:EmrB/QacA subfamily drug resistance transporter